MRGFLRRPLVVVAVVAAFAALGGGAYAASQSGSNPRDAFLNDVAKRLHVSPQKLRAAVRGALLDRLNAAVKDGKLTQAQANAFKQRIGRGLPPFFGGPGMGLPGGPFVHPPGSLGPPGSFGGLALIGPGGAVANAARYLGVTPSQLFGDLRSGRSLARVAESRGKSVAGLERAMTAAIRSKLDAAVAAGRIDKSQAQRLLSGLSRGYRDLIYRSGPQKQPPGPWNYQGKAGPRMWRVPTPPSAYPRPVKPSGSPAL